MKQQQSSGKRPTILIVGHDAQVANKVWAAGGKSETFGARAAGAIEAAGDADGIILTGGSDVSPGLYGQEVGKTTYGLDEERDMVETYVLEAARKRGIPVLGICRGAQMLNVFAGGTLHQELEHVHSVASAHKGFRKWHWGGDHAVTAERGSLLERAWGKDALTREVLSIHHQAVDAVGAGLRVAAREAEDGIVEAIESTDGWWRLGVQFHPEMRADRAARRIFEVFVQAVAERAGLDWTPPRPPAKRPAQKPLRTNNGKAAREQRTLGWAGPPVKRPSSKRKLSQPGVTSTWLCFRCNVKFDLRADHLDHMRLLHGVELEGATR